MWLEDLGSSNGIKVNGERCDAMCVTPGDTVTISKHSFTIQYDVAADAAAPQEENTFSRSLMEKAGLEVERRNTKDPKSSRSSSGGSKQTRRATTEDDFIMDWLNDE